jgi:DNA-binding response OmpR family regulator
MSASSLSRRSRIFLVEDDRMVRETITMMLEDDYDIDVAVSVRSALVHLRAPDLPPTDVILLDCLLPDGNLADVLAEANLRAIPIVLISGDPAQAEKIDPSRRFLSKPFTVATLLTVLDTARR